ncbi:hypothetical protein AMD01_22470 [Priestia koreensis]|uniref:SLH domain-containing protein n=2 Tax=Priestia koreensis TaxID=284581 RepID=A0A0M0KEX6_9BACI|nr:hypothetical protein AMD01_22470 [Priestia koreensis]
MVANALDVYGKEAKDAGFKDINDRVAKAVNPLKEAGIISGKTATEFKPDANITRGEMAIIVAKAYGLKAVADVKNPFKDATGIYTDAVLALYSNKVASGTTADMFGTTSEITRGQFAIFLYNVERLPEDPDTEAPVITLTGDAKVAVDFGSSYVDAGVTVKDNKDKQVDVKTEIKDAAGKVITNIDTKVTGTYTITYTAKDSAGNEAKPVVREVTVKAPLVAEVQSASAINAKEIKVTFNKEVNEASAINEGNYTLKLNGTTLVASALVGTSGEKGTLSEDGRSVTFQLVTPLANADKYAVHVSDGVVTTDYQKINKYIGNEQTFSDNVAPTLLGAKVVAGSGSNKKVQLTFSEPVAPTASGFSVKVDGVTVPGNFTASSVTGVYTLTSADISATNDYFSNGDHEVVVYNATDVLALNPNVTSVSTTKYTVSADVTAPVVSKVEAVNSRSFRVVFSEALSVPPTVTVKKGNYTFPVGTGAGQVEVAEDPNVLNSYIVSVKEDVSGALNPLYAGSETSSSLSVNVKNYKDNANLLGQPVDTSVTLSADTLTPAVTNTNLNSITGSTLNLKFNGPLDGTATDNSKIIVRDKDGVVLNGASVSVDGTNKSILHINLATSTPSYSVANEPYSVEFKAGAVKFAKDTAAGSYSVNTNVNTAFLTSVVSTSNSTPVVEKTAAIITTNTVALDGKITINYGENMDSSAKDLTNYKIDGVALPSGTTIDFVGGKQIVVITLPTGTYSKTQDAKLTISTNVKNAVGSRVVVNAQTKAPVEKLLTFTDNVSPELTSAIYEKATSTSTTTRKIKLTFSENLDAITSDAATIADFKVVVNGNTATISNLAKDSTNAKFVYVTLADDVNIAQNSTISVVPEGPSNAVINVKDVAGNKLKVGSVVASTSEVDTTPVVVTP